MQLPSAVPAAEKKTPSGVSLKPTSRHEMEDLQSYAESLNRRVEMKALECKRSWEDYVRSFANYTSVVRINGKPVLPPVMNPDRRQAMRACRDRLASNVSQSGNGKDGAVVRVEFARRSALTVSHDILVRTRTVRVADASAVLPLGLPCRDPGQHQLDISTAARSPARSSPTPPPAESRQRPVGGTEGSERSSSLQALRRSAAGVRRSSSCGHLYRKLSVSSGGTSAGDSVATAQLTTDPKNVAAAPPPAVSGSAAPTVATEILPARYGSPLPTVAGSSGAQVATASAAAAVSRNRLAVRYMSAGGLAGPPAALRQPFFPPVSVPTVQAQREQPHLDGGEATGVSNASTDGVPKSLLDRVALSTSFDEGEVETRCGTVGAAAVNRAKEACFRHVTVCAIAASVASDSAVHPGERRAADGREASSAAVADSGDGRCGGFRDPVATSAASNSVLLVSAAATGAELCSLKDGSSSDEALSQASGTATLTADTNLPSHLLCSASTADTLASTTTLGHFDEQQQAGSSCCCGCFSGCGCGGDPSTSCDDRPASVACPALGNEGSFLLLPDDVCATADGQSPPRLLRSNSYTLQNPSPALLRAQQSKDSVPTASAASAAAVPQPLPPLLLAESSHSQLTDADSRCEMPVERCTPIDGDAEIRAASPTRLGKSSISVAAGNAPTAARRTVHRRLAFEIGRQEQLQQQQQQAPQRVSNSNTRASLAKGAVNHSSAATCAAAGTDVIVVTALATDVAASFPPGAAASAATVESDCRNQERLQEETSSGKEEEEGKEDEEEASVVQQSLVLLKSKVHEKLLTRMRSDAPQQRPSTAVPPSISDRAFAAPAAASDGHAPLPARPSTSDGVIGRRRRDAASVDVAYFDVPEVGAAAMMLECSQWLTVPDRDGYVEAAEPAKQVAGSDRERRHSASIGRDWRAVLAACVRGHLTRRLLETEKVKFLRKTVQDCRQLLANLQDARAHPAIARTSIAMDANLRERIAAQLASALGQIHGLFFVVPAQKRMTLIHQHRVLEAERKLSALIRATSAESKRHRVSLASSSKVVEKRGSQERPVSSRPKSSAAPRRSASPKKTSLLSVGRVAKTIHRRSPVRRSGDGVRKRLDGQEYMNGN